MNTQWPAYFTSGWQRLNYRHLSMKWSTSKTSAIEASTTVSESYLLVHPVHGLLPHHSTTDWQPFLCPFSSYTYNTPSRCWRKRLLQLTQEMFAFHGRLAIKIPLVLSSIFLWSKLLIILFHNGVWPQKF